MDLNSLDDAEKFQKHFVTPMVDAVRQEISPLVKRIEALETGIATVDARVKTLEGYAKKLGTVYSGVIAVVTFLAHWAFAKFKSKFNVS